MEDWDSICHYFATPEFKKMSARNKANRAKQNTPHVAGTKSFARLQQEEKATTGSEPGQIKLYKMTRFSGKKNAWVPKDAEENHEKMENLQKNVLSRGSRLDNRGGTKTSSSSYNKQVKADWEDYKRRAEQAEQENSEIKQQNSEIKQQNMVIQQQNTEMQLEMQEMKASHKRTDEMLQALMAQLQTGGDMGFMRLSIWFI